jgi:cyclopropane fatty-acyl-phospholipid synthase-like methyltransferase
MIYFIGKKKAEFYKDLLIRADLGLHEQIAKAVARNVTAGSKILDLGAGEGALSARLADMGYTVTAADKDKENFKCSTAVFTCIDFDVKGDLDNFVEQNLDCFDAVLGIEVIEHVQDQWQYVRQLMKMLKPNGLMIITTPNTGSWLSRLNFMISGRFHQFNDTDLSYGHISPVSPWELDVILREVGAKDIVIQSAGTLPPIYIDGSLRMLLANVLALLLRPFSTGVLDGWCVMALARKPE